MPWQQWWSETEYQRPLQQSEIRCWNRELKQENNGDVVIIVENSARLQNQGDEEINQLCGIENQTTLEGCEVRKVSYLRFSAGDFVKDLQFTVIQLEYETH